MATTPLSQAVLQGMDPNVYRPLSDISQGDALFQAGNDGSPTSKWGAIGRLASALSGTYLQNSATSDLAKTIANGKKKSLDDILASIGGGRTAPIPTAPPAMTSAVPAAPAASAPAPAAAPVAVDPGSANAQVAARFPAAWSPEAPTPVADAAPAAAAGAPAAVAANAPRGIRNNNPLNIEAGDFTKGQPGFAGSDGRFAKFETPEHGVAAANKLLDVYEQKHGLNTVAGIVGRWAPSADGNNTMAYAADVAGRLGIDPNAPVPKEMRPQLIAAMAQHENGQAAPGADQAPYKVAGPAVAAPKAALAADDEEVPANAAATSGKLPQAAAQTIDPNRLLAVLQNPYADETTKQLAQKLLLKHLSPEEDEFASSPQGIFNKRTGELKKGGATADFGGLQGPDLMAAVKQQNPALASQAQAVLEGRVPYPSGSRLNPQQQQLKELVTQIDPNFTAANSKVMSETLADYGTKGRTGQARVAANTMLGHADVLDKSIDKLGNYTYGSDAGVNKVHDFIAGNTDPAYQKARADFETTKKALSIEAEKALAGHTTVSGIHEQMANFDRAKSPEELHSAVKALVHVLGSRLDSMAAGFDTSMKTRTQGHEFLDAKGREIFNRFEGVNAPASSDVGRIPGLESGAASDAGAAAKPDGATPGTPDRSAIEAEMRKRGLLK